ncbi:PASTA domain-containing protein [Dankookia sp. P2]|uniref:PASTA domain-containing protein n=1 Tax=Dankookia sp. P2 TaxID=3423955 RepID=UPI003D67E550
MPAVIGKEFTAAVILLSEAGLTPVNGGFKPSSQAPGVVTASNPAAGAKVAKNEKIKLTLALPPNTPDPCIRRDLVTSLMILCNRTPIAPSAVRNPAFNATLLDAIKPRTP